MNQPMENVPSGARPAPKMEPNSESKSYRLLRYVAFLALPAALSTFAGFQAARFSGVFARWLSAAPVRAASVLPAKVLVSSPHSLSESTEFESIRRLAPQQQAERLLELAIDRRESSLDLIRQNLDSWRGHLEDTDRLFHLVLAALESNDPRVRVAAIEIDLAANNLRKS